MTHYDVVVVGLGVMGSASVWQLAKQGARVLGIETGGPSHIRGSSHGETRIFRRAYWEGESYSALLALAHQGWMELERTHDSPLTLRTGGVFIGPRQTGVVQGSVKTALASGIAHEELDTNSARTRFPQFVVQPHMHAVYEPEAYAVLSTDARLHMLNCAVEKGAQLWFGRSLGALRSDAGGLRLKLRSGEEVTAGAAVITLGAWIDRLVPELKGHIAACRIPVYWFKPKPGREAQFDANNMPVFLYECDDSSLLYGIPNCGATMPGVKIGFHNRQLSPDDPDLARQSPSASLRDEIGACVAAVFPGLDPTPVHAKWCFYTMSSDESFLLGASRLQPHVYYASACSGHGFKFAPAVGSVMSALALGMDPLVDVAHFGLDRLA